MNKALIIIMSLAIVIFSCEQKKYEQGKRIYDALCLQCHMADGSGLGTLYPDLSKSTYLTDRMTDLPCLIRKGKRSDELATVYMPAQPQLREAELSNLINYINYTWGDQSGMSLLDLKEALSLCP